MPRDISGNYTLPAGNPVVTGTTIASTWANTTLSDIATALTQSLSIDGSVTAAKLASNAVQPNKMNGYSGVFGVVQATSASAFVINRSPSVDGIQFPSTQVPSADPNNLDDYEEGTWTPTIQFDVTGNLSLVYSAQNGRYTKIGNLVRYDCFVATTTFTHTTATGSMYIGGLPFASGASMQYAGIFGNASGLTTGGTAGSPELLLPAVTNAAAMYYHNTITNPITLVNMTQTNHTTGVNVTLRASGEYLT